MSDKYQVTRFRAHQLQTLRNLTIHSPGIVQILTGSKRLFYKNKSVDLAASTLLLTSASTSLSFENLPQNGYFESRMFSLYCLPTEEMLVLSQSTIRGFDTPTLKRSKCIDVTLQALSSYDLTSVSEETQTHLLMGLYQQLAEQGALHHLFPDAYTSFSQELARYLSDSPEYDHSLESVAKNFATSRATLIRRLKQEGMRYRDLLAEVRLNHALELIQDGTFNIALLAQSCGYQSESRFSQRFRKKFGVSPREYIRTLS